MVYNLYQKNVIILFDKYNCSKEVIIMNVKHNDDIKAIEEWELIKEELKLIESMIILYED